jgi:hypothetical protein
MIPIVQRRDAMKRQTGHQHVPGIGYIVHSGPPDLPAEYPVGSKPCEPPADAADGSLHVLRAPQGGEIRMRWIAAEQAWAALKSDQGNRMAWPTSYLSRAGWEYMRPEETQKRKAKR